MAATGGEGDGEGGGETIAVAAVVVVVVGAAAAFAGALGPAGAGAAGMGVTVGVDALAAGAEGPAPGLGSVATVGLDGAETSATSAVPCAAAPPPRPTRTPTRTPPAKAPPTMAASDARRRFTLGVAGARSGSPMAGVPGGRVSRFPSADTRGGAGRVAKDDRGVLVRGTASVPGGVPNAGALGLPSVGVRVAVARAAWPGAPGVEGAGTSAWAGAAA